MARPAAAAAGGGGGEARSRGRRRRFAARPAWRARRRASPRRRDRAPRTGRRAGRAPTGARAGRSRRAGSVAPARRRAGGRRGLDVERVLRRRGQHGGVGDLAEAVHQLRPLARLQRRVQLAAELGVRPEERMEADVDVVVVVGQRERVVGAGERHQRDDLVRLHRALEREQAADRDVGDRARALVADDRDPVDRGDVDGVARRVLADVARRREVAVAAVQRADGRLQTAGGEELERREDAAVDVSGLDVAPAAVVDLDVRAVEDPLLQRLLAHQQDLADRRVLRVGAEERVLAGRAVDRRGLEQLPAVEDRLRVDARGALAGRADLEQDVRGGAVGLADAPEDRAGDDLRADLQLLELDVVALEAVDLREEGLERREAGDHRAAVEELVLAAALVRARAVGVGEQALLGDRRLRGGRRLGGGAHLRRGLLQLDRGLLARACGRGRLRIGLGARQAELLVDLLGGDRLGLRDRVAVRERLQVPVRVRVAVHVAQHDELAEALALADLHDPPVLDGDDRRARLGVDVDAAARGAGLDRQRGVALRDLLRRLAGVDVVGVAGLGVDGEVALRQTRERADEVGGQAGDQPRAHEHRVDVPARVVVGEDRAVDVLLAAGRLEVARGGEDRVDRVVRVALAVVVGVGAVHRPGRGHELHPADRAGGRDVEVAPVVRLDLVDRREDLPADAVLDAGRLVDRQQERRDPELVDEEVRDADRRGAGLGEREGRVRRRGGRVRGGRRSGGGRVGRLLLRLRRVGLLRRLLGSLDLGVRLARLLAGRLLAGRLLRGRLLRRLLAGARRLGGRRRLLLLRRGGRLARRGRG